MPYAVAVDIGGTFTDLVAYDHETHAVVYTKAPTTYGNFVEGILDCFAKAEVAAGRGELPQPRHDAGDQCADSAQRRQGRAGHDAAAFATCSRSRAATGPIRSICIIGATSR